MTKAKILRFYLDDGLRSSAKAGTHPFIGKMSKVAESAGIRVEYRENTTIERAKSATRRGYAMFHMDAPTHDRALTFRRVYHYPFWAIESSAKRWEWRVAQTAFPVSDVVRKPADAFYRFWQNRLYGDAPTTTTRDGFVYVPLQGRLLDHRSFQHCTPLSMIKQVLSHDTDRAVIATLHPNEIYTDAEMQMLEQMVAENPRLTVEIGEMTKMLQGCDYVVTQNSSAAFAGYFFGKPAVLFGQIDFHHIAANVSVLGVKQALEQAVGMAPDYAGYLHWFWQTMSINAGRPEAEQNIRQAMIRGGWPV